MSKRIKVGDIYGSLTITQVLNRKDGRGYYLFECKCNCGAAYTRPSCALYKRAAHCQECATRTHSKMWPYNPNMGMINYKHGRYGTKEYRAWRDIRDKCNNPKNRKYPQAGGKGIGVCDQWDDFETFLNDMGEAPKGFALTRKDKTKDYQPNNCVWAVGRGSNKALNIPCISGTDIVPKRPPVILQPALTV